MVPLSGLNKKGKVNMRENFNVKRLVLTSILLAIIIVFQAFATVFKIGVFQITVSLIPITIGAIILGPKTGSFLGFMFGVMVLATGDAASFMIYSGFGTVVTVLVKGTVAGAVPGIVYNLLKKKNKFVGSISAAILTPIVNTGVFALGTMIFLMDAMKDWSGDQNPYAYLFLGVIGFNFLVEFAVTIILCPTVNRICDIGMKKFNIDLDEESTQE